MLPNRGCEKKRKILFFKHHYHEEKELALVSPHAWDPITAGTLTTRSCGWPLASNSFLLSPTSNTSLETRTPLAPWLLQCGYFPFIAKKVKLPRWLCPQSSHPTSLHSVQQWCKHWPLGSGYITRVWEHFPHPPRSDRDKGEFWPVLSSSDLSAQCMHVSYEVWDMLFLEF